VRVSIPLSKPSEQGRRSSFGVEDELVCRLAQARAGNEGLGIYREFGFGEEEIALGVWLDPDYTACEALAHGGPPGVILVDRREA
jgi:hypothetical protein